MKQLYVFLAILFFILSCGSNPQDPTNTNTPTTAAVRIELHKTFYKKMKGSIGDKLSIIMDLTKKDSALSGSYYYDKIGLPITIQGNFLDSGKFEFTERNEKNEETGKFVGSFTSEQTMEGTWTNTKTKKELPFKLTETTEGIANVSFQDYHAENCDNANKNKKNKPADGFIWDTLCTTVDINLIKISTANPDNAKSINQIIVQNICQESDSRANSIDEFLNNVTKTNDEDIGYSLEISSSLVTNDNNILCVDIGQYGYDFGAAHPSGSSFSLNFDIRTGKQILLEDVLITGFKNKLDRIGEKIFIETNGMDGWDFEAGHFELNNNYAITTGGFLFTFNQYEIGPYVMGSPQVFIPYSQITDLIKPNGLLAQWSKR